jgi:hypothetical protein
MFFFIIKKWLLVEIYNNRIYPYRIQHYMAEHTGKIWHALILNTDNLSTFINQLFTQLNKHHRSQKCKVMKKIIDIKQNFIDIPSTQSIINLKKNVIYLYHKRPMMSFQ